LIFVRPTLFLPIPLPLSLSLSQFKEIIGRGSFKDVYRAQDMEHGIMLAWNEVKIGGYSEKAKKRILNEVKLLRDLEHPNLIGFYGAWLNKQKNCVVFITELMHSGTLRKFVGRWPISRRILKHYCLEILSCLSYLHKETHGKSGKPCIIHRDLKCDNIFMKGRSIKIGDLGLARSVGSGMTVTGTPEFMAPDMYMADRSSKSTYTHTVDIWAFAMCVVEMVTNRTPYAEHRTVGDIMTAVMDGADPGGLDDLRFAWPEAHTFVKHCMGRKVPVGMDGMDMDMGL